MVELEVHREQGALLEGLLREKVPKDPEVRGLKVVVVLKIDHKVQGATLSERAPREGIK